MRRPRDRQEFPEDEEAALRHGCSPECENLDPCDLTHKDRECAKSTYWHECDICHKKATFANWEPSTMPFVCGLCGPFSNADMQAWAEDGGYVKKNDMVGLWLVMCMASATLEAARGAYRVGGHATVKELSVMLTTEALNRGETRGASNGS